MKHRTNIYLTHKQVVFLKSKRAETGVTAAEYIRRLLDERIKGTENVEEGKEKDDPS